MANVVLSTELYKQYKIFYHKIRSLLLSAHTVSQNVPVFFLTWAGKQMTSTDVNFGISHLWAKAGLLSKIGPTILRKTITTKVHH